MVVAPKWRSRGQSTWWWCYFRCCWCWWAWVPWLQHKSHDLCSISNYNTWAKESSVSAFFASISISSCSCSFICSGKHWKIINLNRLTACASFFIFSSALNLLSFVLCTAQTQTVIRLCVCVWAIMSCHHTHIHSSSSLSVLLAYLFFFSAFSHILITIFSFFPLKRAANAKVTFTLGQSNYSLLLSFEQCLPRILHILHTLSRTSWFVQAHAKRRSPGTWPD